jgi:hypothetical protein
MTDIKSTPDASIFTLPSEYQKIDADEVKAQATAIFQVAAQIIGQMVNQASVNSNTAPAANASPAVSPAR